jgi:hypothetical protein
VIICCLCGWAANGARLPRCVLTPLLCCLPLCRAYYVPSLKQIAVLRLLKQLSEVYSTMKISAVAELVPFATFGEVEAMVVDAVKYDYLQVCGCGVYWCWEQGPGAAGAGAGAGVTCAVAGCAPGMSAALQHRAGSGCIPRSYCTPVWPGSCRSSSRMHRYQA